MTSHAFSTVALLLSGLACTRNADLPPTSEPFSFSFVSGAMSDSGQLIEAIAAPEGKSVPTTFRLWLAQPGLASNAGDVVRAVMRRGEPGGTAYLLVMLGAAFVDSQSPSEPSGALVAIDLSLEVGDSLPLSLSIRSSGTQVAWLAEARLANGGRFLVTLDERTKRGEFRRVSARADMRVFTAIAGLLAPR